MCHFTTFDCIFFGLMLGQLWTDQVTGGEDTSSELAHVCVCVCVSRLVAIYPVSLQDMELLGSSDTLYNMCVSVSVLALEQLCRAGPLGPSPCFVGLETLSTQTGQ